MQRGNPAADAIDQQPWAGLPYPSPVLFAGQRVVHVQHAPRHEAAIGHVMLVACSPLALLAVDGQGANAERAGLILFGLARHVGGHIRHAPHRPERHRVHPGRGRVRKLRKAQSGKNKSSSAGERHTR